MSPLVHSTRCYSLLTNFSATVAIALLSLLPPAVAQIEDVEGEAAALPLTPAAMLGFVTAALDNNRDFDTVALLLTALFQSARDNPAVYVEAARYAMKVGGGRDELDLGPGRFRPGALKRAQLALDRAIELDPSRADTYVLYGHLAFQQRDQPKAMEMLKRAEQLGTTNPWLIVNKAEVLYQQAELKGNEQLRQQALALFEQAVGVRPLHPSANSTAARDLTVHYIRTRQLDQVDRSYRQWIEVVPGNPDPPLRYGIFLMDYRNDLEGALVQARASVAVRPSHYGNAFLARMLAVKASKYLLEDGERAKAWPLFEEAQSIYPDLAEVALVAAHSAPQFIAVRGLHEFGIPVLDINDGGFTVMQMAIQFAASADAVRQALELGADPNEWSSDFGTPLHSAIFGGHREIVALLLKSGADPTTPYRDGRTPIQIASGTGRDSASSIVKLLETAIASTGSDGARAMNGDDVP